MTAPSTTATRWDRFPRSYPYTHQVSSCGALCRILQHSTDHLTDVQTANGIVVQVRSTDLVELLEFNGVRLQHEGFVAA